MSMNTPFQRPDTTPCVHVRVRVYTIERKGSELSSKSEHRVLPSSPTHEFSLMTLHTDMI